MRLPYRLLCKEQRSNFHFCPTNLAVQGPAQSGGLSETVGNASLLWTVQSMATSGTNETPQLQQISCRTTGRIVFAQTSRVSSSWPLLQHATHCTFEGATCTWNSTVEFQYSSSATATAVFPTAAVSTQEPSQTTAAHFKTSTMQQQAPKQKHPQLEPRPCPGLQCSQVPRCGRRCQQQQPMILDDTAMLQ
jgi:hypothetical protein